MVNFNRRTYPVGELLSAVDLSGAAATRTFTLGPTVGNDALRDYEFLIMYCSYTYAAAGQIRLLLTMGLTSGSYIYYPTVDTVVAGTANSDIGSITMAIPNGSTFSASAAWKWKIAIDGSDYVNGVFTHSGTPTSGDLLTVTGRLIG